MSQDKDLLYSINRENGLTRINRAIYKKLLECQVPAMIIAKPAYSLAQMYIQALDFVAKTNELVQVTESTDVAEKILEIRESVKSLRYFSQKFGRGYYVLMDRLNELTGNWQGDEIEESSADEEDGIDNILDDLESDDLKDGLKSEIEAHNRQQHGNIVKKLISKGCPEDMSNAFTENLFELKLEAISLVSLIDQLIVLNNEFDDLILEVEEILVEISIPWVGFSPGETAHALWHIGNHDEDNFFFMGFLGWSLAILENLQANTDDL